jgi:hypothetical protein
MLDEVEARGFIPAAHVAEALGCATSDDVAARLRSLDGARATYIPGLGLCSAAFAAQMRKGLRRVPGRKPAA